MPSLEFHLQVSIHSLCNIPSGYEWNRNYALSLSYVNISCLNTEQKDLGNTIVNYEAEKASVSLQFPFTILLRIIFLAAFNVTDNTFFCSSNTFSFPYYLLLFPTHWFIPPAISSLAQAHKINFSQKASRFSSKKTFGLESTMSAKLLLIPCLFITSSWTNAFLSVYLLHLHKWPIIRGLSFLSLRLVYRRLINIIQSFSEGLPSQ